MRAVRRAACGGGAARGPRPRPGAGRPALSAARPGGARASADRAARGVRGRLGAEAEGTRAPAEGTEVLCDLPEATVAAVWAAAHPKPLLRIGKGGVKPSHVRSLGELLRAHAVVKVRLGVVQDFRSSREGLLGDGDVASGAVALMQKGKEVIFCTEEKFAELSQG